MKRYWIRRLLGGLSFTSALFVFQACYGTPQDVGLDILIEGQVKSQASGLPIPGVKVTIAKLMQYEFTNEEGKFSFYTEKADSVTVLFEDVDKSTNGVFAPMDTTVVPVSEKIALQIVLEEN